MTLVMPAVAGPIRIAKANKSTIDVIIPAIPGNLKRETKESIGRMKNIEYRRFTPISFHAFRHRISKNNLIPLLFGAFLAMPTPALS